jgi:2-methylcitrate dehydratase
MAGSLTQSEGDSLFRRIGSIKQHEVRVRTPGLPLAPQSQLAWKLAAVAMDDVPVEPEIARIVIDRIIDDAAAAAAALHHHPVTTARRQAMAHPRPGGAAILGLPCTHTYHCEWAAWANCAAVRELDLHDNFFALDSCHPGDSIPPILAVAQQCGRSGIDLVRAIATAYEIQLDLAKSIPLGRYQIDHVAHLGPAVTAGLGALLGLQTEVLYQAIQHSAHVSYSTRQARKGQISTWRSHAPGHVGKLAIEAVDRAMRGETAPSPLYEGEYSVVAAMLGGTNAIYHVPLPELGEPKRSIRETFTKEYAAGYQGQAIIDLAFRLRRQIHDFEAIESIVAHVRRAAHVIMGSGANDPEKWDPTASRETLDHSLMYICAVALQDGVWHFEHSYAPERARRPDTVRLWQKISTLEDEEWNRRYDSSAPLDRDHGGRVIVTFKDGSKLVDEIAVADAHPRGARPYKRDDYIRKFMTLSDGIVARNEAERFLEAVQRVETLKPGQLETLSFEADRVSLDHAALTVGIF